MSIDELKERFEYLEKEEKETWIDLTIEKLKICDLIYFILYPKKKSR